ncbi:MAG: YCF48-related protein, partial [Bacteroidota bacterium]
MKKILLLAVLFIFSYMSYAQEYKRMISDGNYTVQQIQAEAEVYFAEKGTGRGTGFKPYKRWEYQAIQNMDENGMLKSADFYIQELENYNSQLNASLSESMTTVGNWQQLGPFEWNQTSGWNPGVGRVTAIASESGNSDHMIVGGETGGVWKTLDGGTTWQVLTDNMPSLNVYSLAIDPTNPSIYYWGSSSAAIFKSSDAGATWTLLNDLGGGTVNKILIDATNTNKMYMSIEFSGLYKTTDGGVSWSLIHPNATNGYDFEFKPGDTSVIYASGNDFFISQDSGNTFETVTTDLAPWTQEYISGNNNWTIASNNQNNTVAPKTGNGMGFFYVGNFSSPITRLISPSLNIPSGNNPQLKFSYTNVNWAGDIDTFKVLYKTAENAAWIELAEYTAESDSWNDQVLNLPSTTSDYYIAFEATANYGRGLTLDDISIEDNSDIYFTEGFENGSASFGGGPKMIAVSPADAETIFVLEAANGLFGGLYKSSDGGSSFTQLDHSGKNYFGYSSNPEDPNDLRGQAPRDMDIVINPTNIDDVHIAGINTWRSTNGGVSFNISSQWVPQNASNENIGYCHADVDILEFIDGKLYAGTDGGIFVAENPTNVNSNYYTDLSTGLGIRQFYKIGISQSSPVMVTGGSQDNGTSVMGTDGIWRDWLGADGMESFVDKDNNNILYGTSQFGTMYKSFNAGNGNSSFIPSPENKSGNWVTPFEQDPIAANTIYVGYDEVYKSSNGGSSWVSVSQNFGALLNNLKIAPSNGNFQYASFGDQLYRNTNVGLISNWTQLTGFSGGINSIAIHPNNPNRVAIATTSSQKVYVSDDAGNTWQSYQFNLPNFSARALVWDNTLNNGLYLGMNYGVFYISDEYSEWQPFSNNLPNVIISELEINEVENKIYASTYGRGLWVSNEFDDTLNTTNFELESLNIFPNPASDILNLKWDRNDDVSIKIFDSQG